MKTLGLIGGTSWVSTVDYYTIINRQVNKRLGGLHSARLLLYSLNFEEFKPPANPGHLKEAAHMLTGIAQKLEVAGAACIVICANTPHIVADAVQAAIQVPLIHIATVTSREISNRQISKVGLLGTKFTMEQKFFRDRLSQHGIDTIIPDESDREFIHQSIYNEFGKGIFTAETKSRYLQIIDKLGTQGAQGVILGCTEIPMLIKPEDTTMVTFDTTLIHATAAVDFALSD